jgi:hypothetical protein
MTKLTRFATLTGLLAALAIPGTALAHGGGPGHDQSDRLDDSSAQTQKDRGARTREDRTEGAEARGDDAGDRAARRTAHAERKATRLRHTELRGTVKAVDAAAQTVTVTVARAQRHGRAIRGKDVVFTITDGTRVQTADRNADGARDLADVAAGDRIRVVARVSRAQLADGLTTAAAQRLKARAPKAATPAA